VLDWNGGARLDFQMGAQQHLMIRGTKWIRTDPAYAGLNGATSHPSAQGYSSANSDTLFATFSKVLGNRGLNELKGGFTGAVERNRSVVTWSHHPQAIVAGVTNGAPRINFNGYSFGNNNTNWPQTLGQQGRVTARGLHLFVQPRRSPRRAHGRRVPEHLLLSV
jgi:hypothetical protein